MDNITKPKSNLLALPHLDWHAYWIAALAAGLTSLLFSVILSGIVLGEPGFILRLTASLVLGADVIPATQGNPVLVMLTGLLIHFALSFFYALLVVLVIHRWGLIVGLIGGALVGLALYVIDVYALSNFFSWIYPVRNWILLLSHVTLGSLVGVVYELLDQTGAVLVAGYDPNNPNSQQLAQMAYLVGQLVNMKFGREDEIQSDALGVRLMAEAGYDPRSMIDVMQILAEANPGGLPEFFSTHPNPDNRIQRIQEAIQALYPNGVPEGLIP